MKANKIHLFLFLHEACFFLCYFSPTTGYSSHLDLSCPDWLDLRGEILGIIHSRGCDGNKMCTGYLHLMRVRVPRKRPQARNTMKRISFLWSAFPVHGPCTSRLRRGGEWIGNIVSQRLSWRRDVCRIDGMSHLLTARSSQPLFVGGCLEPGYIMDSSLSTRSSNLKYLSASSPSPSDPDIRHSLEGLFHSHPTLDLHWIPMPSQTCPLNIP